MERRFSRSGMANLWQVLFLVSFPPSQGAKKLGNAPPRINQAIWPFLRT
jgi:hypothetical protein